MEARRLSFGISRSTRRQEQPERCPDRFFNLQRYQPAAGEFSLLPFQFERFRETEYLLTNDLGEMAIVDAGVFASLIDKTIDKLGGLSQSPIKYSSPTIARRFTRG
jgi:hypothetical protein